VARTECERSENGRMTHLKCGTFPAIAEDVIELPNTAWTLSWANGSSNFAKRTIEDVSSHTLSYQSRWIYMTKKLGNSLAIAGMTWTDPASGFLRVFLILLFFRKASLSPKTVLYPQSYSTIPAQRLSRRSSFASTCRRTAISSFWRTGNPSLKHRM
jgi:hypothetical protein